MLEDHLLPPDVRTITGQTMCPFGDGALRLSDALLAAETCEELFTPQVSASRDCMALVAATSWRTCTGMLAYFVHVCACVRVQEDMLDIVYY